MKISKLFYLLFALAVAFYFISCESTLPTASSEFSGQKIVQGYENVEINPHVLPKAKICSNCTGGYAPLKVVFNGSKCSGNINAYEWDLCDGEINCTDQYFTYIFKEPGSYVVRLKVTDEENRRSEDVMKIKVLDKSKPARGHAWEP